MNLQQGDARALPFDDDMFDCVVTSPPFWGQRAYGEDERELGKPGQSLAEYVHELTGICDEVARVLKPTGTFWLNIGDAAAGSGGAGGDYNAGGSKEGRPKYRQGAAGMSGGQWAAVQLRVVDHLQGSGWKLRSYVIWDKGTVRRESLAHARRPGVSWEAIFMLTRGKNYFFDHEQLVEKGNVWHFAPNTEPGRGFAPFPRELPRRCLLPSTVPGDTVLDPFAGSGTTLEVAEELELKAYGIDLYA